MIEEELIDRLKDGDSESFEIIVSRFQKKILNCCYRFVNNSETAEDLTQDVFIEVYRSINSFKQSSTLSTWIYRIAVSKSLDYIKSKKRKKRYAKLKSLFDREAIQVKAPDSDDPLRELVNEELAGILSSALEKIPESQRVAFTLSQFDDMSYKEISEVMNVSVSSVESLIYRGKQKLRKLLYNYYSEFR